MFPYQWLKRNKQTNKSKQTKQNTYRVEDGKIILCGNLREFLNYLYPTFVRMIANIQRSINADKCRCWCLQSVSPWNKVVTDISVKLSFVCLFVLNGRPKRTHLGMVICTHYLQTFTSFRKCHFKDHVMSWQILFGRNSFPFDLENTGKTHNSSRLIQV